MKTFHNLITLYIFLLASPIVLAQEIQELTKEQITSIDSFVTTQMEAKKIPGMVYAISYGDKMHIGKFGYADIQNKGIVQKETRFLLASVTKQFTAAAIVLLQQDGKLNFSDPINKYLPESIPAWDAITIHHLLTHTSGLPGQNSNNEYQKPIGDKKDILMTGLTGDITKNFRLNMIKSDTLSFEPGSNFDYSNTGYFLLGVIIDQLTGSYDNFLKERIFDVLDMKSTYIIDPFAVKEFEARNYGLLDDELVNNRMFWDIEIPASYGIYSTGEDMLKWGLALDSNVLFTNESKKLMWSPNQFKDGTPLYYGYGWGLMLVDNKRIIRHSGVSGTEILKLLDDKLTIVTLTNLGAIPYYNGDKKQTVNSWNLVDGIATILGYNSLPPRKEK